MSYIYSLVVWVRSMEIESTHVSNTYDTPNDHKYSAFWTSLIVLTRTLRVVGAVICDVRIDLPLADWMAGRLSILVVGAVASVSQVMRFDVDDTTTPTVVDNNVNNTARAA